VWADLARDLMAVALTERTDRQLIPLNSCYIAAMESRAEAERLAAWLNSTWIRIAARMSAVPAASGFARFAGATIGGLPLPTSVLRDSQLETITVTARAGELVQDELDDLTAHHLGLTGSDQSALRSLVASRAVAHR
jgi:hypothetical protein